MSGDDSLEMILETVVRSTADPRVRVVIGTPDGRVVRRLVDDSREVRPGDLFVARGGSVTQGTRHIRDAVQRGAVAVLAPPEAFDDPGIRGGLGDAVGIAAIDPLEIGVAIAQARRGDPASRLETVGITGTNGKTTIATIVRQLVDRTVGRCGLVGTIELHDGLHSRPARITTPGRLELVEILAGMVAAGCGRLAIEVSSHALDQRRVTDLDFRVAIFTNLSGDHLDYHGTMASYASAKATLFSGLSKESLAVVNLDDPAASIMLASCPARRVGITTRLKLDPETADLVDRSVSVELVAVDDRGMHLRWTGLGSSPLEGRVPLVGTHNAFNVTAALLAAMELGADPGEAVAALEAIDAPRGRLEPVHGSEDSIRVYVDYAHTDDAIRTVLAAVRPSVPPAASLVAVIGAGGDRDRTKRPRMMRAALDVADRVIVTSDNPRTEDPESIVAEVLAGALPEELDRTRSEVDRAIAIEQAILGADGGDLVVIAGKGHEDYQIVGSKRRPFDDRLVASAALARRRDRDGGDG